jgi:hypothetical protein
MPQTIEELNADLVIVNNAISELIQNKRVSRFRIGSGTSIREYQFSEITMDMLNTERSRIFAELNALSATDQTFRTSSRMQTTYSKF